MSDIWLTSDTHFGHGAILRHMPARGKVFATVEEMGAHLVDETNRVVKPKDILIHAGDFAWKGNQAGHYRQRLNVREIHATRGNHDAASLSKHVSTLELILFKKFGGNAFHIQHYPCCSWNKRQHGGYHVYGHSHGLFEDTLNTLWPGRRAMDIGVDHAFRVLGEWRPFHIDEVLYWMEHPPESVGTVPPGDHHFGEQS